MNIQRHTGILLLPGILLLSILARSQEVNVKASLDTSAIRIGEQTVLTLTAEYPEDQELNFPVLEDTFIEPIEIVKSGKYDTSQEKALTRISRFYTVTAFDSGYHVIPPLPFNSKKDSFFTEPVMLQVNTLKVDTTKAIKPVKGIKEVPLTFRDLLPYILGALALAALIVGLIYFLRKRKGKPLAFTTPSKPQLPADEEAFERLKELENQKLWQNDQHKKYYIELTSIIRHYIERRFEIDAEELTTSEIIEKMQPLTDESSQQYLKELLELADLVKFARMTPLPDQNDRSYKSAWAFVEKTTPRETTEQNEETE